MKKLICFIFALFSVACVTKPQPDNDITNKQLYVEWLSYRNAVKLGISVDSLLGSWTLSGHLYDPIDNLTLTNNGKYSVVRVKDYDSPEMENTVRQGHYQFDTTTNILTLYGYYTDVEIKNGFPQNQKYVVELSRDTLCLYEYGAILIFGIRNH